MEDATFTPMPEDLRERLRDVAGNAPAGGRVRLSGHDPRDRELETRGMLSGVSLYRSGDGTAVLTARGASYERDLADWRAVREWRESGESLREDEAQQRAFRHDWRTVAVNAAFAISGAVVGSALTWLLGKYF